MYRIHITNWKKFFRPRKDVRSTTWFRMQNDFFEDPDFFNFSSDQKLVWIFILSRASKKMTDNIKICPVMVGTYLGIPSEVADGTLKLLDKIGVLKIVCKIGSDPIGKDRKSSDSIGSVTQHNITNITNITEHNETGESEGGISDEDPQMLKKNHDQKSDTKLEPKKTKFKFSDWDEVTAGLMKDAMLEVNPDSVHVRRVQIGKWANEFRLMRERDKITQETIERALDWVFKDEFWRVTLKSPGGLRKNWDTITGQMRRTKRAGQQSVREVAEEADRILAEYDGSGPFGNVCDDRETNDWGERGDMGEVLDVPGMDDGGG